MKKMICALIFALVFVFTFAAAESAFVSISNGDGSIVLARESVELSDADNDGIVTINDALYLAHEAAYDGGANAGYLTEDQGYGLCICKLWGEENGGSYGYYLNNAPSMNLLDAVADGDHVQAYAYADPNTWSDTFSYFDKAIVSAGEVELTLNAVILDANWVPSSVPVEGAMITIDGVDTGIVTDAEGKAVVQINEGAELISASSDSMVLVPAICLVEG